MNFKLLVLLILVSSCGVKGFPTTPKNAYAPSVLENYPDITVDQSLNDSGPAKNAKPKKK